MGYSSAMAAFDGLDKALRWLRVKHSMKQYQVADSAGITKAMLSAYETGKQKPSLESLEKILSALACDLGDLYDAIEMARGRPWRARYTGRGSESEKALMGEVVDAGDALSPDEEAALLKLVEGFYRWIQFLREPPAMEPGKVRAPAQGKARARGGAAGAKPRSRTSGPAKEQ